MTDNTGSIKYSIVVLEIDNQHRLCVTLNDKFKEIDEPVLKVDNGLIVNKTVSREISGMGNILNYAKKELSSNKYLKVEEFFMERIS